MIKSENVFNKDCHVNAKDYTVVSELIRIFFFLYLAESKVLQYFGYMKHNLAASDIFAKIVKGMNYTGLCDGRTRLILSKCYSLDLSLWVGAQPHNSLKCIFKI